MKPLPAPQVPGKSEFERFDNAMRQVLSVSKEELLKREAKEKTRHAGRRTMESVGTRHGRDAQRTAESSPGNVGRGAQFG